MLQFFILLILSVSPVIHSRVVHSFNIEESPTILTKSGLIQGEWAKSATDRLVGQFLGIPYARPPIGELRFQRPLPIEPWNSILNATSPPNSCYQLNDTTFGVNFPGTAIWNPKTQLSEDCLYLNIWTPYPRPEDPVAVLLWIYGGGFNSGSIGLDLYDGKILVAQENVIVVTVNYRVGNLGFLYFENGGENGAPGNAGLYDQLMALEWIHANIEYFGGNKDKVTLFGESAGAASIGFQLLSPLSRSLFNQAILQSAGPTVPWAITEPRKIHNRGLLLAKAVGCPYDETQIAETLKCLRETDPLTLISNEIQEQYGVAEFAFTPIVDGIFLKEKPEKSLEKHEFKNTNLLLGSNLDEGNYLLVYYLKELFKLDKNISVNRVEFEKSVRKLFSHQDKIIQESILHQYTNWVNPEDSTSNRDAINKLVGDYHFTCPVAHLADAYSAAGNDVYMYYFTHRSSPNPWPKWAGVMHGDEINFVFGEPLNLGHDYSYEEKLLSQQMMNAWANFAKTGKPTAIVNDYHEAEYTVHDWPLYTTSKKQYLTFSVNISSEIGIGPRTEACAFWNGYIPRLAKDISCHKEKSSPSMCPSLTDKPIDGYLRLFTVLAVSLTQFLCNLIY